MKLAVFGARYQDGDDYNDYSRVCTLLDAVENVTMLISGGGFGVEQLAARYAQERDVELQIIPPALKHAESQNAAYKQRNQRIIQAADLVLVIAPALSGVFPDIVSHCIVEDKPVLIRRS